MDFSWNPIQVELYDRGLKFAKEKLRGSPREQGFPLDLWKLCGEFGFFGLCLPEEYGGLGLDALTTARVVEAFGEGCNDTGLVFSACAHLFACAIPLLENGNEELKKRLLPRLSRGEWIGANAITEAEAGSDVFALQTRAIRDAGHYRISGTKSYVTNGPVADVFLVYGVTNPKHGYLGLSAFLVEKGTTGLTIGEPFKKIGLSSAPICSVYLEDCRVPVENLVGEEGSGAAVFRSSMHWERACLFAAYVGAMERELKRVVEYAKTRKQFGKAIGKNQAISHKIVDMKLRLESARLLLYRACWLRDQGREATTEVSLAKIAISEAAVQLGLDAIHIHGGIGVTAEARVDCLLRDALPATIFSGTTEIQRDLVARSLGL